MEEEKKMKGGPIDLDWDLLLPRGNDDEPPPVLVVTAAARNQSPPPPMGGDQEELSQRDELFQKSDRELEDAITRLRSSIETIGPKLPDKGEKLRASLKRLEDEKEHRKLCRVEQERLRSVDVQHGTTPPWTCPCGDVFESDGGFHMDDDGCEMLTQSKSPNFTSASDGLRQAAQSSLPASQSIFTRSFCKKMVENTGSRTVNAFESELSYLGRCDRRKMRPSGQFSPRGRHKKALSSRKSPFQCPTILSVDVDKHEPSNGDQNDGQCSTPSPCHFEETLSGSFSMKRKASQVLPSNDLRPRNGRTVVLVDEEEPKLVESVELEDKLDECMKGSKIYYPSSDDPESIEICYSDMECLAPEAYLSSTIINFYIRYLQHPTSSTNRVRCDYHFFNTYFYKKLKEAVLNKSNKESIFAKFRRWWKGVSIFHKAYIILPIHENLHWSLIIICIPDKEDESGPIILHLDSLGLHSSKTIFDSIKSFLKEEWKYLDQGEYPSDLPIADRIWKNLPRRIEEKKIVVPQQRNDYDCGLFVLFFMERFIDEAPQRLKRKDLAMFGKKWFKPEEASNLRHKIRRLLVEEFRNATKDKFVLDHEPEPLSSVSP